MFKTDAKRVAAVLILLLLIKAADVVDWPSGRVGSWLEELVTTASNRGLNKEAREALTAGYYEGLLNEGSRLSTMNRFVLDNRRPRWEDNSRPESRRTGDFLYYEHIPNASTPDYQDDRFNYVLTTNSAGLGDKEYTLAKPEGTLRVALLGDSVTRGLGAPPGGNFESLLEDRLNEEHTSDRIARFEWLNFAVSGYHITQLLESAKLKAAPYRPDIYVVALTDLSVYRRWHGHISSLMYAGIDLKYDYLKNMVAEAGLTPEDPIGAFDAKLARHRIPTIRWVLGEIKAHAEANGATIVALLVPSVQDPAEIQEAFLGVREVLDELDIRAVDLLDTFVSEEDRLASRISDGDRHPNALGHRLLFEQLYRRLSSDPLLSAEFLGLPDDGP